MDRRRFLLTSLAGATFSFPSIAPRPAHPQQSTMALSRRVGFLCIDSCTQLPVEVFPGDQPFASRLAQRGYVIGRDVGIDSSAVGTGIERVRVRALRLLERGVGVIVAVGTLTAATAREITTRIPIVMMGAEDPVEEGLVASLARPGGNITGIAIPSGQLAVKQIELVREIVPTISRLAILWTPKARQANRVDRMEKALSAVGVRALRIELANHLDIERALATVMDLKADALLPLEHLSHATIGPHISQFALRARLPMVSTTIGWPLSGALLRYGPNGVDLFEGAADYVAKIFNGAKPSELPVEEPRRFELSLNVGTAKALGRTIPPSLLARADQVIDP
jgi:putative tryptophan/tyrosine transport system substrate-binding protein